MTTKKQLLALAFLLSGTALVAQPEAPLVTEITAGGNYFVTILVGVMLAIGFQFALTALSIAVGVSAIPNLKEAYVESKYDTSSPDKQDWNETKSNTDTGVMISSALGIWNVLTAAISLFGATALALSLTHVVDTGIAITLGLAIWSVFYLLMFYLEGKMAGTLIGSLINTAVAGLRAGADAVKSAFTPSPATQVETVANNTIEKLRQEMSATFDTDGIANAINNFTNQVDKVGNKVANQVGDLPSYDQLKNDLERIATESSKDSGSNPAKWTAIQSAIQTVIDKSGDGNGNYNGKTSKINQLKELYAEYKDRLPSSVTDKVDGVMENGLSALNNGSSNGNGSSVAYQNGNDNGSSNGTSVKDGGYERVIQQVTSWLQSATPDNFDVEKLSQQLQAIVQDPAGNGQQALEAVKRLDKNTVLEAITNNTSLDREQVDGYADRVTEVLAGLKSSGNSVVSGELLQSITDRISAFVDSTDDPRLRSADLKSDFQRILNNPSESLDVISARLNNYDRDTLISVLTNNSKLSRRDIDNYVAQVESARNTVSDQIQAIKDKANSSMNQASRMAVIQADGARKAAVAASWWLFTAIVASGVAAMFGATVGAF